MLAQKCLDGNCRDKALMAGVERAIRSSYGLRNKCDLTGRAFQGGGISQSGDEVVDLMAGKSSNFGGGKPYVTVKQRIIDRFEALYERFSGLGE